MARAVSSVGSAHNRATYLSLESNTSKPACEMCFVSFFLIALQSWWVLSFVEHEKGMRKLVSNANGIAETVQR